MYHLLLPSLASLLLVACSSPSEYSKVIIHPGSLEVASFDHKRVLVSKGASLKVHAVNNSTFYLEKGSRLQAFTKPPIGTSIYQEQGSTLLQKQKHGLTIFRNQQDVRESFNLSKGIIQTNYEPPAQKDGKDQSLSSRLLGNIFKGSIMGMFYLITGHDDNDDDDDHSSLNNKDRARLQQSLRNEFD